MEDHSQFAQLFPLFDSIIPPSVSLLISLDPKRFHSTHEPGPSDKLREKKEMELMDKRMQDGLTWSTTCGGVIWKIEVCTHSVV